MAKPSPPRISVNKLGEYLVSKPRRQTRILYDQKNPPDYVTTYYRDAQEAISLFLVSNMEDNAILERMVQRLDQMEAHNVYETRRIAGNIDAIESFMNVLDDIDLHASNPRLGENAPQRLTIRNVEVSVRPEIILTGDGQKGRQLVGGIKLHFPKANPLSEDAAGYVSAVMQMYCDACLHGDGRPHGPYCMVIDVASATVWPGVRSIRQRVRDVEAACEHIAALWPTIPRT